MKMPKTFVGPPTQIPPIALWRKIPSTDSLSTSSLLDIIYTINELAQFYPVKSINQCLKARNSIVTL